jgi:hypothetical protein
MALAKPRLPSAFSKSMGFTLCGIADDPISPAWHLYMRCAWKQIAPECAARHLRLLLEKTKRDVTPNIAAQVDEDRVDTLCSIEKRGHVVVMFDLSRALKALQTEREGELIGEGHLANVRISDVNGQEGGDSGRQWGT